MLIIKINKDENIDIALKRFKIKFRRTKVAEQLRERMQFDKPSVKRRKEIKKAKYITKKELDEEQS